MNTATAAVIFDEEKHTYTKDGALIPSVTTVLRQLYNFDFVHPDVLAAKAALGTAVHKACELDDADDLDDESLAPAALPYLQGYRKFKRDKLTKVVATELIVYSAMGYAGKLDLLTEFDGELWLIDWKTPLSISAAVGLQTAGYAGALPRELLPRVGHKVRRGALQLKADGNYKLHEFKDHNDYPTFISFLNAYRWTKRHYPS